MGDSGPASRGSAPRRKSASAAGPMSRKSTGHASPSAIGRSVAPVFHRNGERSSAGQCPPPARNDSGVSRMSHLPPPAAAAFLLLLELPQPLGAVLRGL